MPSPLRMGVVGVGQIGSRHAQIYAAMPGVKLMALCDTDLSRAQQVPRPLGCRTTTDYRQLAGLVDAVSLAVPTSLHGPIGRWLLAHDIHALIEKPIATTLREADALIRAARRRRLVLQVGHVERFNAAIRTALDHLTHPRFIEVHRLSPYPHRSSDVSVILDVMIHDLDLILALVRSPVARIDAIGVPVLSKSEDIANARVAFTSGCVANLTASRISDETLRRIRVFQEESYLSIDYQTQTVELACLSHRPGPPRVIAGAGRRDLQSRTIRRVQLPVNRRPPLQEELAAFVRAIARHQPPIVTGEDGRGALELGLRIERAMRRR